MSKKIEVGDFCRIVDSSEGTWAPEGGILIGRVVYVAGYAGNIKTPQGVVPDAWFVVWKDMTNGPCVIASRCLKHIEDDRPLNTKVSWASCPWSPGEVHF